MLRNKMSARVLFGTADKYKDCNHYLRAEQKQENGKESTSESNQILSSTKCESEERVSSNTNTVPKKRHTMSEVADKYPVSVLRKGTAQHNTIERLFKKRLMIKDPIERGVMRPESSRRKNQPVASAVRVHSPVLTTARELHTKATARLISPSQTRNALVVNSLLAQAVMKWPAMRNKQKKSG